MQPNWHRHPQRIDPLPSVEFQAQIGPSINAPTTPSEGGPATTTRDAHHYAWIQEGNVAVGQLADANTKAPFLLQPSTKRNFLGLRNSSAAAGPNVYIGFGQQASTFSWMKLAPGDSVLFDEVCPQNDLYALADGVSATLSYAISTIADQQ